MTPISTAVGRDAPAIVVVAAGIGFAAAAIALVTAASSLAMAWPQVPAWSSCSLFRCVGEALNNGLGFPGLGLAVTSVATTVGATVGGVFGGGSSSSSSPGSSPPPGTTVYIPGVTAAPSPGQTVYLPGVDGTVTVKTVDVYKGPPRMPGSETWQVVITTDTGQIHQIITELQDPYGGTSPPPSGQ